jgi:hemerythrin superfamily protein
MANTGRSNEGDQARKAQAGYGAGSEGFAGDENASAPVTSADETAAGQRKNAAGSTLPRQHTAREFSDTYDAGQASMHADFEARDRGEFPVERPMDALRADHHLIRQQFERYFRAQDTNEKRDVGPHILMLLEMHTSLEEGVFYPRVREADAALIAQCEQQHEQAKQLIEKLKIMDESDPQTEQAFHQLAEAIFEHVEREENQLFPKIEQANLDLSAIGHEMLAFETGMIASRTPGLHTPGMMQGGPGRTSA